MYCVFNRITEKIKYLSLFSAVNGWLKVVHFPSNDFVTQSYDTKILPVRSPPGFSAGKIIFAVLAKFLITVAWANVILHSMELFPTIIR